MNRPSPRVKKWLRQLRTAHRGGLHWEDAGGMCGMVSADVEDQLGWPVVRGAYRTCRYGSEAHVWNLLPGGRILDATADQFGDRTGGVRIIDPGDALAELYDTSPEIIRAYWPWFAETKKG